MGRQHCFHDHPSPATNSQPCSPGPPQVARPRPDFIARCFPSTLTPVWGDDGMPQCEASVPHQAIKTGMRSFPSGAWALVGGLANTSHSEPALQHERPPQRKCDHLTHPCTPRSQCMPHGAAPAWASCACGCWVCCAALPAAQRAQRSWRPACCRWLQRDGLASLVCRITGEPCMLPLC